MLKDRNRYGSSSKFLPSAPYFVWDDEVAGFGVRVMPSGAKTYQTQYRKGGRTRRVSLGRHGTLTADEARKRARELLGRVAGGENPAEALRPTSCRLSGARETFLTPPLALAMGRNRQKAEGRLRVKLRPSASLGAASGMRR